MSRHPEYEYLELMAKILKDGNISKEQFDRMCQSWASLESNIIQFTKENQKLREKQRDKDHNIDLEPER